MKYGQADYLLYCFKLTIGNMTAYLIDFPALQQWFWTIADQYPASTMKEKNQTRGRIVPIRVVRNCVGTWQFNFLDPLLTGL